MIDALIIEDEPQSRRLLKTFIKNYCSGVTVIGEADSITEAIKLINQLSPNLVFLDIELKDGKGFEILDYFINPSFVTILITGYNHYAIDAIKKNALDYILKPVVVSELIGAVEKAKKKIEELKLLTDIKEVVDIKKINDKKVIVTNNQKQQKIIDFQNIIYLEAQNQYTKWHLKNMPNLILRNPLSKHQNILPQYFFQIHRSFIVNLNLVSSCDKGRGGFIELDTIKLPISYRRKAELIHRLKQISSIVI